MNRPAKRNAQHSWLHHRLRHFRYRPRLTLSAAVGVAILLFLTLVLRHRLAYSVLAAYDVGAALFLSLTARMMARSTPDVMISRARTQDEGRWVILGVGVFLSMVVLRSLSLVLHDSRSGGLLHLLVAAISILLSWLFMTTIFALHYAHDYYGGERTARGGLAFPGTDKPDYWDFLYFAIVLSMTFQVSDVQITSRPLRHLALLHGLIAFFFTVIIIAITVNVVANS
jgi:uncharacterized membrane protein